MEGTYEDKVKLVEKIEYHYCTYKGLQYARMLYNTLSVGRIEETIFKWRDPSRSHHPL